MLKLPTQRHDFTLVRGYTEVSSHQASSVRLSAVFAVLIMFASLSLAGFAHAATYYVSTTGNDSGSGTQSQPWQTIQKAANSVNPGDTVLVAGGTYKEIVKFTRSGTASQKITFKNVSGQTPVIDGQGISVGTWGALVSIRDVGHFRFEGFEVRNSSYYVLWMGGESHHLELVNLDVHDGSSSGIWVDGPKRRPAFSSIKGCRVYNNAQGGITLWGPDGGYYLIEGNDVYKNIGSSNYDGVQIGGGSSGTHHIVVRNNRIHDNGLADSGEDNLDLGGHGINHHYLVEGNDVYGGRGSFKLHSGSTKDGYYTPGVSGFHIARFNTFTRTGYVNYGYPNPTVYYNNTFVDSGQTLMIYNEDSSLNKNVGDSTYTGGDTGRMNWKNNIFWQESPSSSYAVLSAGAGSIDFSYRSVRLRNNLYKFSSGQKVAWKDGIYGSPVTDSAFANYQNSSSPNYPDSGSFRTENTVSQMFSDYTSRDYQLVADSPAIDKGLPLTESINSGANTNILKVDRASYFQDGYCVSGECLSASDTIVIGENPPVRITSIDDVSNTITIASPQTWKVGDVVTLEYSGAAPDLGAFEFALASDVASPPMPPTNIQ